MRHIRVLRWRKKNQLYKMLTFVLISSWKQWSRGLAFQSYDLEKKLLDSIAEASYAGKPFLVSDVIFANQIGSPATLSRRLNSLVDKELIFYAIGSDSRKKFLELTPKSKKYFAKLEELILLASSKRTKLS